MVTSTRKQREIQNREHQILALAGEKLLAHGYLGLNMDAIAAELEYSKGTIYNHFGCKEEIIIALAIETMEIRTELFLRGAGYKGLPRERLTAIGVAAELFVRMYPQHFQVEHLIRSNSIWDKASQKRRRQMLSTETRCISVAAGVVRDAIAQGHLTLPDGITPEALVFGLWSQTFGAYSIIATGESLQELGIPDPFRAVRTATVMTMDGYGWQPLSGDYDYYALFERLLLEVFPDECRQAKIT